MKNIKAMRLLSQEKILKDDIYDAKNILNDFIHEYEFLYSADSLLSNVHGHLHFPQQVLDFGPLKMFIFYSLENHFFLTRDLFHSTRNFEGQIAKNIERRKLVRVAVKKLAHETPIPEKRFFI